jgi:UDP-glucose 4-epimerase
MDQLVASCDGIFHLASIVGVRRVLASPLRTLGNNIASTENVLALASEYRKPVLIASSSEVYGRAQSAPLREDADLNIGSPEKDRWAYACSKATCEFLARAHFRERQLPVVIVRLFNTVGPRQTDRYGMVIPTFVRQGLAGSDITVFGDGQQTRCFVHVRDVVRAMTGLLPACAHLGQIYNLGSNQPISSLDLAHRVRDLTGACSKVIRIPYQEAFGPDFEEPLQRVPDVTKLGEAIGWTPSSDLDRILQDVVTYCSHPARTHHPANRCVDAD